LVAGEGGGLHDSSCGSDFTRTPRDFHGPLRAQLTEN
jgi:hypothetical protein